MRLRARGAVAVRIVTLAALITRADGDCSNYFDEVEGNGTCATLSSLCSTNFCDTCDNAGWCDQTCGFGGCTPTLSPSYSFAPTSSSPTVTQRPTPTRCFNLLDAIKGTSEISCDDLKDVCDTTFCDTCTQSGFCDLTCDYGACAPTGYPTTMPSPSPTFSPSVTGTPPPTRVPSPAPSLTFRPTSCLDSLDLTTGANTCYTLVSQNRTMCDTIYCDTCLGQGDCDKTCSVGACAPTGVPTGVPTPSPSLPPTPIPSSLPTMSPTLRQTTLPSASPSSAPTPSPSPQPTALPSRIPTFLPTFAPSAFPSYTPTGEPTVATDAPAPQPSDVPTSAPTRSPSPVPYPYPTYQPSPQPSRPPSPGPSGVPTALPSPSPTPGPSVTPKPTTCLDLNDITLGEGTCAAFLAASNGTMCEEEFCGTCSLSGHCDKTCLMGACAPTSTPTPPPSQIPTPPPSISTPPTPSPSRPPSSSPSPAPSLPPTALPSPSPTPFPTYSPTESPTSGFPTSTPKPSPVPSPFIDPTSLPSPAPSITPQPTGYPSYAPTKTPSAMPTPAPTAVPSPSPTLFSNSRCFNRLDLVDKSGACDTYAGYGLCTTSFCDTCTQAGFCDLACLNGACTPTLHPTPAPTPLTWPPSLVPTPSPTVPPTANPTALPYPLPTTVPSRVPSPAPTLQPSPQPSFLPSPAPSHECEEGTFIYRLWLYDSGGDGWQGSVFSLRESSSLGDSGEGVTVANGTLSDGTQGSVWLCLANGCFELSVGGGTADSEIGFEYVTSLAHCLERLRDGFVPHRDAYVT